MATPRFWSKQIITACGIVNEADGKRLYHAGQTNLFTDIKLIGDQGLDL